MATKTEPVNTETVTAETSADVNLAVAHQERRVRDRIAGEKRVRIMIPSGRSEMEKAPVQVGVNGIAFLIKRDVPVDVPESVVNTLNLAKEMRPVEYEENGRTEVRWTESLRFPFQTIGAAV